MKASNALRSSEEGAGLVLDEQDYRILAAGSTSIYLPLSWLRSMKMLPTAVVAIGTSNDPNAGYIAPSFQDDEPHGVIHHIIRNPEMMAQGIGFALDARGSTGRLEGVSLESNVYEIAFAYRPKVVSVNLSHRERLKGLQPEQGWVLLNGTYYDISEQITSDTDTDAYAVPIAIGPSGFMPNTGRFRYNDDLVITYWSRGHSLQFDGLQARTDRESTRALVDWLTSEPKRRDPKRTGS